MTTNKSKTPEDQFKDSFFNSSQDFGEIREQTGT